jgi:hypothetical protein
MTEISFTDHHDERLGKARWKSTLLPERVFVLTGVVTGRSTIVSESEFASLSARLGFPADTLFEVREFERVGDSSEYRRVPPLAVTAE